MSRYHCQTLYELTKSVFGQRMQRMFWIIAAIVLGAVVALGMRDTPEALASTPTEVGYRDFSFGSGSPVPGNPTAQKPQSKLWFNDGSWWGALWASSAGYHIYRFDWSNQSWSDTGTLIDKRSNSHADTLWDGTHLYVATAPNSTSTTDQNAYVERYSYDAATKTYTLDSGFPATVASGAMEAIVLDKDTAGKLWVTYTQGSQVYMNHSLASDSSWGTPFVPSVPGTSVKADDISAVIAYDSKIGVMWSNQNDGTFYFATHQDGDPDSVWQESIAAQCLLCSDDHINLKSLAADSSGRVFAAVKTSLGDKANPDANAPLIWVLVIGTDGKWKQPVTFGTVKDDHTRPQLVIDEEHRNLYVFATAPVSPGGVIYYKKASLDNVTFPTGLGTPFIKSSTDTTINNATTSKHNVNSATGILVEASDNTSKYYLHNTIDLNSADTTPPDTTIDSGPTGTVSSGSASFSFSSTEPGSSFECRLDNAAFSSCTSPKDYTGLTDGSHTFQVRATDAAGNTDATPTSRTWTIDTTAQIAAPSGLKAARSGSPNRRSINLTWTDNSSNEDNFTVERCTGSSSDCAIDSSNWKVLTSTLTANTTSYADKSVSRGTRYWYRVKATKGTLSSGYSNVASATTK